MLRVGWSYELSKPLCNSFFAYPIALLMVFPSFLQVGLHQ